MEGWVKLHRKFTEWEWYKDLNTKTLFLHLLLKANHKDQKWQGIMVKRGELITGRKALSAELGMSEQSIRTSLNKLKSTNELTIKTTNKNSVITLNNYCLYQNDERDNQQTNQPPTNGQPTTNQQLTTNNNVNNDKEGKEEKADLIFPKESESIEAIPPDTGKGRPLKVSSSEPEFAPEITARITAATEKIASFFNISEVRQANPWMKIRNFIEYQARSNNLDYLADQFTAYRQLKEKQGFKHTWMNWTGSPSDQPEPYSAGAWTEKNWVTSLKDFQKNEGKNLSPTVSSVDYSKLHEHSLKLARS